MATIGKRNSLKVVSIHNFGAFLDGGPLGDVLLPERFMPKKCKRGDAIDVFLYCDTNDRLTATTRKTKAQVGEIAYLKVVSITRLGAFLDLGLEKDLFIPRPEQAEPMKEGMFYFVRLMLNERKNGIIGSSKINEYLDSQPQGAYEVGEKVDLLICAQTNLGYKAIINNTHWGVLYKDEVYKALPKGAKVEGYIKKIRDDLKIDLTLHKPGYEKVEDISSLLLKQLEKQGGILHVSDKSSPEIIHELFGVSKKTFKKAVGALYRKRIITMENDVIQLSDKKD